MTDTRENPTGSHIHPTVREYVSNRHIAEGYDECFQGNPLFEYDCVFIDQHISPPASVLDLGCGTGRHLVFLAANGFEVTGIDLNPHMLREAKAACLANGVDARLIQADILNLPLNPKVRYDAILLMFSTLGLLHKASDRIELLRRLSARLNKNGKLLFHVHNLRYGQRPPSLLSELKKKVKQSLDARKNEERGNVLMKDYRGELDLMCHFFTDEEIAMMLSESGYRLLELRPLNAGRDGPYSGTHASYRANGFLVAAKPV